MFEHMFSVPLATDEKGFFERECPSENCLFVFKVHQEDWKALFREEEVFCPQCGHTALANRWHTQAQLKHAKKEAIRYMKGKVRKMMEGFASDFNRRQPRNSFITMSMKVTGGSYRSYVLPAPAIESFQMSIECSNCNARFAVIGSAFFCPCCGHSSAERMFDNSLEKTRAKYENINALRLALDQTGQRDEAADICRSLVESCLSDLVGALQRLCEELYSRVPGAKAAPFGAFQRLRQSSELWRAIIGEGYEEWLGVSNFQALNIYYQRRHLLAHREGIVDKDYLARSEDATYKIGQRIVVTSSDAAHMRNLIAEIAKQLRVSRIG